MTRPLPLLPTWLAGEVSPRPGRWRQAVAMSGAATLALGIALGLQIASFPAPLLAFRALQPSVVCTWRNMFERLAIIAAASVAVIPLVGVLVQVPWLLLPAFVLAISALTYIAPVQESPVIGYCVALIIGATAYTAVFEPNAIGSTSLELGGSFAIGLVVATVIAQFTHIDRADERLRRSLAAQFARARTRLRDAGARYRGEAPALAEQRSPSGLPIPADVGPGPMPQHLQLLNLIRQEGRQSELERAFVALITVAERIDLFVAIAESVADQPTGRGYRALLDGEIAALLQAIDSSLARFEDAARDPACVLSSDAAPATRLGPWPDFAGLIDALRSRQHALRLAGQTSVIEVEESANLNSLVQALEGLADVLHLPPEGLEHFAPEVETAPPRWAPFNPYAAQFALKIGIGCALCLLVGVASHARAMETIILNPLLLTQGSYGATLRRTDLRIIAVIVGGLLSALTTVVVMPNTTEPAVWLLVFFAVLLPNAYLALGTPRFGYFGLQVATTYMIVLVAMQPVTDIHNALWRFFGTLLGSAILLGTFQILLPDYAGRQIVSRFAELLRALLSIVPSIDRAVLPVSKTQACSDRMLVGLADVLRLSDELWYEGPGSGVDRQAAVHAAGLLRRVAHRWALVRRGRRVERPALPPPVHDAIATLESALVDRLRLLVQFVEARHDRGRPGSRSYRAARARAAAVAARPRADLIGPLQAVERTVAEARQQGMAGWSGPAASGLLAEVGHLHRLVDLLPALDDSLLQMSLPVAAAVRAAPATALQTPAAARGKA